MNVRYYRKKLLINEIFFRLKGQQKEEKNLNRKKPVASRYACEHFAIFSGPPSYNSYA